MLYLRRERDFALTRFSSVFPKRLTPIQAFDARLTNRPLVVFDFRALRRSGLSAGVPESQKRKKIKWSVSQSGIDSFCHCTHFGTMGKN